jgi:hypothetical protein
MPRCFFNIHEGEYVHMDDVGHDCQSLEKMECEAATTAASIARDHAAKGNYLPVHIEVTGEGGQKLLAATVTVNVRRY